MRITIEDSEVKVAAASAVANSSMPPTIAGAIDAGPPATSLLQAGFTAGVSDAGTPPESLLQALQTTVNFSSSTGDAGAAPAV